MDAETEDYTDWESVDEGEAEEEPNAKAKPKAAKNALKAPSPSDDEGETSSKATYPPTKADKKPAKTSATKEIKPKASSTSKAMSKAPAKGKQGGIKSFFNVAQK